MHDPQVVQARRLSLTISDLPDDRCGTLVIVLGLLILPKVPIRRAEVVQAHGFSPEVTDLVPGPLGALVILQGPLILPEVMMHHAEVVQAPDFSLAVSDLLFDLQGALLIVQGLAQLPKAIMRQAYLMQGVPFPLLVLMVPGDLQSRFSRLPHLGKPALEIKDSDFPKQAFEAQGPSQPPIFRPVGQAQSPLQVRQGFIPLPEEGVHLGPGAEDPDQAWGVEGCRTHDARIIA
jgi:hypothetical protein